jgi:hypothetical protein
MANLKLKTQFNDLVDASVIENQIEDLSSSLDDYALKTQEAFIAPTLLNSWVNFGSDYQEVGYMKDNFGFVHIRGMIKSGTSATANVFTLPVGYRPNLHILQVASHDGTPEQVAVVQILANGNINFIKGSTSWTSFGNISFKAGI